MSEFGSNSNRKKKHPIRNFFTSLVLIVVLFLAALFGDIFPGLNDFRDSLLEQQSYTVTQTDNSAQSLADAEGEIIIQEYSIYYMGETITLDELSAELDSAGLDDVILCDYQGTAKQQTWQEVSMLLSEKGIAYTEKVIQ